tara:strand:+ start:69 stop:1466 length:1398 start_codon:yes stop_codon:yes gene_type:complete
MSIASLPYDVTNANPIGLATLEHASKILSDFGRNGDTYVVHAKEGETVIPMEVLDNNPRLKDMLFQQMRDLDLDPYRYIVGNELNSINPDTGQPEFFIKKLFKGLKKIVKKVAPIVLPIAAPFLLPTMPLFLSTGIGSLAGGLIGGQSPKDALRNAVISGGLAGLGNMAFGQGGFGATGTEAGLTDKFDITKAFSKTEPTLGTTPVGTTSKGTQFAVDDAFIPNQKVSTVIPDESLVLDKTIRQAGAPGEKGILDTLTEYKDKATDVYKKYISPDRVSIQPTDKQLAEALTKDAKAFADSEAVRKEVFEKAGLKFTPADFKPDFKGAKEALAPSALQKYAPLAGLTTLGLYGLDQAGAPIFTVKDEDGNEYQVPLTGLDLIRQDPDRFKFKDFYGENPFYSGRLSAAQGGEIVGPGTATSDSIPAMLSDGEFVMNARAVRGAGGGDRKEGARRMYQMMKKFERVA